MYWQNDHMTGGGVLLMVLLTLAVLGVLVTAAYLLIREAPSRRPHDSRGDARSVLDERLARGEIDVEEYQRRCALLTHKEHR